MKNITIIDFGGQYTHLIARRIREAGVYSIIVHPSDFVMSDDIAGIILSGGPQSVTALDLLSIPFDVLNSPVPLLGICYGHQLIARLCGGEVHSGISPEFGKVTLTSDTNSVLFAGTESGKQVWMSHSDSVYSLPDEFKIIASTESTAIAAFEHGTKNIFGVQFHPEVTHSVSGKIILQNFVDCCTPVKNWDAGNFMNLILKRIHKEAQGRKLLVLLSGGVDSLVATAAAIKAVGKENVTAIHIDTGFMRLNESADVMEYCRKHLSEDIYLIDAGERYFQALNNITEPEKKREIIGALFVAVMQDAMQSVNISVNNFMLVQGTIYPDTIESGGTKHSGKIKTHHNTVKEIQALIEKGLVIEPLRDLYKDEVRQLGISLGLPAELINRNPFPGPGLAIRIIASDNTLPELPDPDESEAILEIALNYGLRAVILPVKSVGVQGDYRTYKNPVCLYPLSTGSLNLKIVKECARTILNSYKGVNRCVFYPLPELPELNKGINLLTAAMVRRLQLIDNLVSTTCKDLKDIWQMPVISLPLFDAQGRQFFVMRPITSEDAMTADVYETPQEVLSTILREVKMHTFAAGIFYDVTTKPPGTIEWE